MAQALEWLLCLAPIAVLFIGITVARVKVPAAAGAGLAAALITAVMLGNVGGGQILGGASTGVSAALSILYAVWPAMFLYDIMREAGAFAVLRRFAESATQDMLALILLFGWVFSSFLQSITGFGVPVAVCAPFLVALGVRPVPAVVMTLIGHSWGNTYGTLGMAWDALVQMGPVAPADMTATACLAGALLWVVNLTGGLIVAGIYGGGRAMAHGLPLIVALSAVMGGGQVAASLVNTTVACFLPSTAALLLFAFLIKLDFYKKSWNCSSRVVGDASGRTKQHASDAPSLRDVTLCASPFVFLAGVSIVLFVIPGMQELLAFAQIGGVHIVGHAGFALLASCLFAIVIMTRAGRLDSRRRAHAYRGALDRLWGGIRRHHPACHHGAYHADDRADANPGRRGCIGGGRGIRPPCACHGDVRRIRHVVQHVLEHLARRIPKRHGSKLERQPRPASCCSDRRRRGRSGNRPFHHPAGSRHCRRNRQRGRNAQAPSHRELQPSGFAGDNRLGSFGSLAIGPPMRSCCNSFTRIHAAVLPSPVKQRACGHNRDLGKQELENAAISRFR